jgi:hypothetical protein
MADAATLIGKWNWVSTDCPRGDAFPGNLEFLDDGTYVGGLPYLNGRQYSTIDHQRISLIRKQDRESTNTQLKETR